MVDQMAVSRAVCLAGQWVGTKADVTVFLMVDQWVVATAVRKVEWMVVPWVVETAAWTGEKWVAHLVET